MNREEGHQPDPGGQARRGDILVFMEKTEPTRQEGSVDELTFSCVGHVSIN